MQYFQTRFLEEADKFIAGLDAKSARKELYNIYLLNKQTILSSLKSYKTISGNLELNIWDFKLDFFLFGTK